MGGLPACAVVLILLLAQAALALSPLTQDRRVRAHGLRNDILDPPSIETEEELFAPDFEVWVATATALGDSATQTSTIGDALPGSLGLSASGTVRTSPPAAPGQMNSNVTESDYTVSFQVDQPSDFTLSGSFEADRNLCPLYNASVSGGTRLTGPGGIVEEAAFTSATSLPLAESGQLAPGTYTFEIWSRASATALVAPGWGSCNPIGDVSFDVQLALQTVDPPPVPALPAWAFILGALGLLAPATRLRRGELA